MFGGEIRDKQGKIQGYLDIVSREGLENAQAIINEFAGTAASALAGANLAVSVANLVATQIAIRDLKKTVTAGFAHMSSQFKSLNARHDLALYSELVAAAEVMRAAEYLPEGSGERSAQAQEALRLVQPAKTKLLQLTLAEASKATELAAGRFDKVDTTLIGPPDEVARPLELLRSACYGAQLCALVRAETGNLEGAQRLFDEDLEALQMAYLSLGKALFTQRYDRIYCVLQAAPWTEHISRHRLERWYSTFTPDRPDLTLLKWPLGGSFKELAQETWESASYQPLVLKPGVWAASAGLDVLATVMSTIGSGIDALAQDKNDDKAHVGWFGDTQYMYLQAWLALLPGPSEEHNRLFDLIDEVGDVMGQLEVVGAALGEARALGLPVSDYWRRLEERAGAALEGASEDEVFVLVRQELELAE